MKPTLRQIVLLFTLLSAFFILGLSGYFLHNNTKQLTALEEGQSYASLLALLDKLLYSLAQERGLHKATKLTRNTENKQYLILTHRNATQTTDELIKTLSQHFSSMPPAIQQLWAEYKRRLDALAILRNQKNSTQTFKQYSHLINYGIILAEDLLVYLPTRESLKYGGLWLELTLLREQAGRERGRVFKSMLEQHFSPDDYFAITGHIQQQTLMFELFQLNADPFLRHWWQQKSNDPAVKTVKRIHKQLMQRFQNQQTLAHFLTEIGYNGFIHYYKNYLLRGEPFYYQQAKTHIHRALDTLHQWKEAPFVTRTQQVAMQSLLNIFTRYQKSLETIKQLKQQKLSIAEIDAHVRIDDLPAAKAISTLEQLRLEVTPYQWWQAASRRIDLLSLLLNEVEILLTQHLIERTQQLRLQQNMLFSLLTVFLILLVFVFFSLMGQIKALNIFTRKLTEMTQNNHFGPLPVKYTHDEVSQLTRAFNQLINERLEHEKNIWQEANLDPLTNLPNRKYLLELLEYLIKDATRRQEKFALLFIDLDGFKAVNDTEGHKAGDELLKVIAERFNSLLRKSDIVARIGGDEFVIALPQVTDKASIAQIVRKLLDSIHTPIILPNGKTVRVSGSIGITLFPDDGTDVDSLMMHADIAMYAAKAAGKNTYRFYQPELRDFVHEKQELIDLLDQVDDGNYARIGLELYYQPILNLQDNHIHHFEALLRWNHPEKGLLSPADFIPLLEETKHIIPVGSWVAEQALQRAHALNRTLKTPFKIAINLSAVQAQQHFDKLIKTLNQMEKQGYDLACLHLEMTESLVLNQNSALLEALNWFKSKGCVLYLDDFGTGYSALSYLKHFPFDTIKIDKSFIQDIHQDQQDHALVMAILSMAKTLDMRVVAEGVEDAKTLNTLRKHACHYAQGYHISPPMPAEAMEAWLKQPRQYT